LFLPFVFWRVQGREVFPPEPPVATTSRPGRRAVVKGAPPLGAAKQTLDWFDVGAFADANGSVCPEVPVLTAGRILSNSLAF
jgi:hypothetical protein